MNNPNAHIETYLDHYLDLTYSPGYAIQLVGSWGAGKTWFIKDYIENKKALGYGFLYVSLFGIANYGQIEQSFFQQLHPLLASKGMKLLGKIGTGLIKATIKVDLNGDNKSDLEVGTQKLDLNIGDYLNKLDSKVIVFDDLERCLIEIPNILGYINQLVEAQQLKVLILANENEFLNEKNKQPYFQIKEKLIGRSFNVKPNFEQAISVFIGHLSDVNTQRLLIKFKFYIEEVYNTANYSNLRHLKQAIDDFGIFYRYLPTFIYSNDELTKHILYIYFSIQFELKKGALLIEEIEQLFTLFAYSKSSSDVSTIKVILNKYNQTYFYRTPIKSDSFSQFFKFGLMNASEVEASIKNSDYFIAENTPKWIKLWYFFKLDDQKFIDLYSELFDDLKNGNVNDSIVTTHLVGTFLKLIELKLITNPTTEVVELGKSNIDRIKGLGKLNKPEYTPFIDAGYGFTYQSYDSVEFKQYFEHLKEQLNSLEVTTNLKRSASLLKEMETNTEDFSNRLTIGSEMSKYYDTPILSDFIVDDFINAYDLLTNENKAIVYGMISSRYKHRDLNYKLLPEKAWLEKLVEKLDLKFETAKPLISKYHLENFIRIIRSAINDLNTFV